MTKKTLEELKEEVRQLQEKKKAMDELEKLRKQHKELKEATATRKRKLFKKAIEAIGEGTIKLGKKTKEAWEDF